VVTKKGEQALPGKNRLKSGICGASIKWAGLDMVQRLKTIREKKEMKFSIIGVGGVMVPEDYDEYRESGADLVQSATGAMWNPYLAQEVKAKSKK
jgi:dihydroorotate dehydrogenase (NAD+) catalytic subunit